VWASWPLRSVPLPKPLDWLPEYLDALAIQASIASHVCSVNFKLQRLPGLLLHDGCSGNGFPAMRHIAYPEFDNVAATKLAIDRQIEQCEVSGPFCQL
jgi:hypothetical protein